MHAHPVHEHQFPQEIFDCIIDQFYDSAHVLRMCALVCSAWLPSARRHLFHRITLGPPKFPKAALIFFREPPSLCEQILECIQSVSLGRSRLGSIVSYIQELHLHEGMSKREWLAQERVLPALLRSLSNLRRLEISRAAAVHMPWIHLPLDVKAALEGHVLKLTSLTALRLSSIVFDTLEDVREILRACNRLTVLEVDHMKFKNESLTALAESNRYTSDWEKGQKAGVITSLDTLVIGPRVSTVFVTFLLSETSPIGVFTIRRLTLSISRGFPEFARLLHASTSVEYLELTLMNDVDLHVYWTLQDDQRFDLSQVPHLQKLRINIDVLQKMDDPLPWLGALLSTGSHPSIAARPCKIETIWIFYSIYLPAPYMDRSMNIAIFDKWREIDTILCADELTSTDERGPTHVYGALKRVRLEFMLENPIGFGVAPRFLKELVLESPGLQRREILRVNASDTST